MENSPNNSSEHGSEPVSERKPAVKPTSYSAARLAVATISGPFTLFGISLLLGVMLLLIQQIFPSFKFEDLAGDDERLFNVVTSLAVYGLCLVFVLTLLRKYLFKAGTSLKGILGFNSAPRWSDIGLSLIAFGGYFITTITVVAILSNVPGFNINQPQEIGQTQPNILISYIIAFIGLVIIPPIFEELIFRGFMFGAMRRQVSFWTAAILVSVAFGLVHGQPNVAVDTFILSIFLCALRERTGAIWAPIILHALKNGLAFTYLFVLGTK